MARVFETISMFIMMMMASSVFFSSVTLAALVRPPVVHFNFAYDMVDTVYQLEGVQLYAGLKAAELEINTNDLLEGTNVSFDYVALPSSTAGFAAQQAVAAASIVNSTYLGFVLSDFDNSGALYAAAGNNSGGVLPVVAPRTTTNFEFNANYSNVVHLRMTPESQLYMMLHHAMHDEKTQCSQFALVARPEFAYIADELALELRKFGYVDPTVILLPSSDPTILDPAPVLDQWFNSASGIIPVCGLFYTEPTDVQWILGNMSQDTTRFPTFSTMSFYGTTFSAQPRWKHPTLGTRPYARLFFVTALPDVSGSQTVAVQYRSAFAAWVASPNGLAAGLPSDLRVVNVTTVPNSRSFEGYVVGKFVGEVLRSLTSFTAAKFLTGVYDRKYFWVGDMTLGPFVSRHIDDPFSGLPDFCNVAVDALMISQVNSTTGYFGRPTTIDHIELDAFQLGVASGKCSLSSVDLRFPLNVAMFAAPKFPISFGRAFAALRASANAANDLGILPGMMISVSAMSNIINTSTSGSSLTDVMRTVYAQRRPTIVYGNVLGDAGQPMINFIAPDTVQLFDDPLTEPTQYSRFTWIFKAVLADCAHALAMYYQHLYMARPSPLFYVAADTSDSSSMTIKSLNTAQFTNAPGKTVINTTDLATIRAMFDAAAGSIMQSRRDVVVMFAANTSSSIYNLMAAIQAFVANLDQQSLSARMNATLVYQHISVAAIVDQASLLNAKIRIVANVTQLLRFPILFVSPLNPFWQPNQADRQNIVNMLNTTDIHLIESVQVYRAVMVSQFLTAAIASVVSTTPSADDIATAVFNSGQTTMNGVVIGPMYPANCTAAQIASQVVDRQCQCFKAHRVLNVYDFRDWLMNTNQYDPHYRWTMPTCGVQYEPLQVAASLNVALIAGVTVPCGAAALAGLLYLALCFGRRNNRAAPKDAAVPFAMVFTDIQSSTSLWARAPEQMGDALEQHHNLIRRLVRRHDGYEVKTIGDSFMVAFKRAADAAEFAQEIQTVFFDATWPREIDDVYMDLAQEALEDAQEDPAKRATPQLQNIGLMNSFEEDGVNYRLNWNGVRVRVGLHWGMGSVKLDPVSQGYDYYGTVVNTAARVEGVGNGGQVLATKDFFDELEVESFYFGNTEVTPMGPQPLRGLDNPVPLFQLCPTRLRGRRFNALRLDVEVQLDDDSSTTTDNNGNTTDVGSTYHVNESPEAYAERLLQRRSDGKVLKTAVLRNAEFLEAAMRVAPASWRSETLKVLLKKWHVNHQPKACDNITPQQRVTLDTIGLCVKVTISAEESRRVAQRYGANDTLSTHSRDRDGLVSNSVSTFRRRSSTHNAHPPTAIEPVLSVKDFGSNAEE